MADSSKKDDVILDTTDSDKFDEFIDLVMEDIDKLREIIPYTFYLEFKKGDLDRYSIQNSIPIYINKSNGHSITRLYITTDIDTDNVPKDMEMKNASEQNTKSVIRISDDCGNELGTVELSCTVKEFRSVLDGIFNDIVDDNSVCEVKDCKKPIHRLCDDTGLFGKQEGCLGRLCEEHQDTDKGCSYCDHVANWACVLCGHVWGCTYCYDG